MKIESSVPLLSRAFIPYHHPVNDELLPFPPSCVMTKPSPFFSYLPMDTPLISVCTLSPPPFWSSSFTRFLRLVLDLPVGCWFIYLRRACVILLIISHQLAANRCVYTVLCFFIMHKNSHMRRLFLSIMLPFLVEHSWELTVFTSSSYKSELHAQRN